MWQLENRTPFATDRNWVRDRDGGEVWQVAVRCTFRLHADGKTSIAEEQLPVVIAPSYFGDPATTSLEYDTDFVLTKPTTDVILHGSAYSPGQRPTTSVDVTLRIGEIQKTLRVVGNRRYLESSTGNAPGEIEAFSKLRLNYERAYGGKELNSKNKSNINVEERNLIGTGFNPVVGDLAPNIGYIERGGGGRPAGFGPIPSHWKPRANYAGTYDDAWMAERQPLYPNDLDGRFFLCAPEDQQSARFLKGGEQVYLKNLTPNGRLSFSLPKLAFGFETVFRDGERIRHSGNLHTVILEPDAERLIIVWQSQLPCHSKVQSLLGTNIWQKKVSSASSSLNDQEKTGMPL